MQQDKKHTIGVIATLCVILMLIFAGPSSAVTVNLVMDGMEDRQVGQTGFFFFNVTIGGNERIPITNFTVSGLPDIDGSSGGTLLFNVSDIGTTVGGNTTKDNYVIELVAIHGWVDDYGYGYGYGYSYGYASNEATAPYKGSGYGYSFTGYGYGYGSSDPSDDQYTKLSYKITVDTTGATPGTYDVTGKVNTGESKGCFSTTTTSFTLAAPTLSYINVTPPSASLNTTIDNETTFTATAKDQYGNNKSVTFIWGTVPSGVGTLNDTTGSAVNFTAAHAGRTEIYAMNGSVSSNATYKVWITVNTQTNTTQVLNGSATATSGDSTVVVKLNNTTAPGMISITELGDPINSTTANGSANGLGTGVKLIKGVNITATTTITTALDDPNNWIHIKIKYNESQRGNLDEDTLFIYKYVTGTDRWVKLVTGSNNCTKNDRNTSANYVWANVTHLCDFGLGGSSTSPTPAPTRRSSSGGGGGGWGGILEPTATATKTPTASATWTATATPPKELMTPRPTTTATETAVDETMATPKKGLLPGFTAVFMIAGLLAAAYLVMRRRE